MSAVREFRTMLEKALMPHDLKLDLWRTGHRISTHLLEVNTRPKSTVLYVKESNTARGFWGLTKTHVDRLKEADVVWFVVLLHRSPERGYLLVGQEVSSFTRDGTFELSGDGDHNVNEQTDLDAHLAFNGIRELLGRVISLQQPKGIFSKAMLLV